MKKAELFVKVPRKRLYQRVVDQIQDLIVTGKLQVGDRLPSEAELCEQFGVSRTVIREATKSLAERGLLHSQPGRGTFVIPFSPQDLSDSFGLFVRASDVSATKVIEVRELLEVKIAELAAERAEPGNLAKMEQSLKQMEISVESVDDYIDADLDFHMALAEATQNDIFPALIGSLVEELQDVRRTSADVPTGFHIALNHHRMIYECVTRRDKEGAADAMRHHLAEVTRRFELATLAGVQDQSGRQTGKAKKSPKSLVRASAG